MIKKMRTRVADAGRRLRAGTNAIVSNVGARIRGLWELHRDRINNDRDYATALGAAGATVAVLFTQDPALLAVVAAVCALYVAVHHPADPESRRRSNGAYDGADGPWSPPRDTWEGMAPRWDDGIA